ncbi:hypothetical protein Slin15195_G035830 [Septoria linicola]|uniref:Uncharacterized protein n=1 Tax=Septoria linicola TaxID=215465 RepID=A0A9Q9EHQ3_9PEZI|nr:hypothetical protein Slin14017_G117190 [Septoria linicola]USW50264.1 hypothetical protein Slin15195_G035830 [Septoria linicola]
MTETPTENNNTGWTRVEVQGDEFATVAGPKCSQGLMHLIVHCDITKKNYGLASGNILDRLQQDWPDTKRLFIQLSFGPFITCALEHVEFGTWISHFVKSVLDVQFLQICGVFVGITDRYHRILQVDEHIVALGMDMRWFADDPAVMIMLRRGCAVDIGKTD